MYVAEMVTEVGGTHPTGMLSCFEFVCVVALNLFSPFVTSLMGTFL